jgi:DegV family protein with EDD domain
VKQVYIVTDSTSDIPLDLAEKWQVGIVPCYIQFGTESYLDRVELPRAEFYQRLEAATNLPTTSAPPSGLFAEVYRKLLDKASGIISLHPPDHLSALRQSALNGWDLLESELPFRAIDTGQITMGLGWLTLRAAQAAAEGADLDRIVELIDQLRSRTIVYAVLDTMKYLHRSGRVGWAQGAIGRLLRIRPMLKVFEGQILSLGYSRTQGKTMEALLDQLRGLGQVENMAILHSNAPALAERFRELIDPLQLPEPILSINITPVLGTHVGPSGIGFAAVETG